MSDERVLERIAAWEAAELIDRATADRLREAEGRRPAERGRAGGFAAGLDLDFDVAEVLGYLGSFFVLGAWAWGIGQVADAVRGAGFEPERWQPTDHVWAIGLAIAAVAYGVAGFFAGRRPERRIQRSAGVWYLVGAALVGLTGVFAARAVGGETLRFETTVLVGSLAWLAAALVTRRDRAAIPTQLGLIVAVQTAAAAAALESGRLVFGDAGVPYDDRGAALLRAGGQLFWTFAAAVGLGIAGHWEATLAADAGGRWRAALTRFAAGLTAVVGTTVALVAQSPRALRIGEEYSDYYAYSGGFPLDDLLILALAAGLVVLAMRSGASAYLYPAGLGFFVALTDLNASYFEPAIGLGPALLVEGLALIGVGYLTNRMRGLLRGGGPRLGQAGRSPGSAPGPGSAAGPGPAAAS